MTSTFANTAPAKSTIASLSGLIMGNVLRVGIVLTGMTLFIAAAEAKQPLAEIDLGQLPQLITQSAHASTFDTGAFGSSAGRPDSAVFQPDVLANLDYSASTKTQNLLNSRFAQYLAGQLN